MHLRPIVLIALALALVLALAGLFIRQQQPISSEPLVRVDPGKPPTTQESAVIVAAAESTPAGRAPDAPAPLGAAFQSPALADATTPPPRRSVADILEAAGDLSDPVARERAVEEMRTLQQSRRAAAEARARELGLPLRTVGPRGRVREVFDLDAQGRPIYRATFNLNATRSSGASLLQAETPPLSGSGVIVGVWDGGLVRSTHQELVGRVTAKNTGELDDHATHVAGTVGAAGVVASARGAAPAVSIHSYDWDDDYAEMTADGATAAGQSTKIYIGNQSYGSANGWDYTGETSPMWVWYGTGTTTTGYDPEFGQYNVGARDIDAVIFATPYLLAFRVAGNDGTDDPVNGESVSLSSTSSATTAYNSSLHPAGDGIYRGGYDTIAWESIGKNVITIGATTDAVIGNQRDVAAAAVVDFSSWGPTDDGRIKPDLVTNGDEVYSPIATSNTAYDIYSGTSMAGPSAAGSAALLVQLYGQLFPGNSMRASTLKALLLHTADDLGTAGPDYRSGWGLINVKTAADLLRDHAANPLRIRVNESQLNTTTTTVSQNFTWDGVSPIRATLCWTDPAGTATTSHDSRTSRLVNNLDLKIIGPDESTHLPYVMPFVGTWT
ncbi:MAG: S8 family serine peptidase, partial [Candidatus Didemnitutus sp.]|nr:S8 family serine peptidase [Candidatus Didemnitutus sp.]